MDVGSSTPHSMSSSLTSMSSSLTSMSSSLTSMSSQEGVPCPDPCRRHRGSPARQHSHCSQLSQSSQHSGDKEDERSCSGPLSLTMDSHVPSQEDRASLEYRGAPSPESSTPGSSRFLSLKRPRTPDSQDRHGEEYRPKKSCPTNIRSGPMPGLGTGPMPSSSQSPRSQDRRSPQTPTKGLRDSDGDLQSGDPESGNPVPVRVLSKPDQSKGVMSGGEDRGESMGCTASTIPKPVCTSSPGSLHSHGSPQKTTAHPRSGTSVLKYTLFYDTVVIVSSSQCIAANPSSDGKGDAGSPFPLGASLSPTASSLVSASVSRSPSGTTWYSIMSPSSDPKTVSLETHIDMSQLSVPPVRGFSNCPASSTVRLSKQELVKTKTGAADSPVSPATSQPCNDTESPEGRPAPLRQSPSNMPSDRLGGREGQRMGREEGDLLDEELSPDLSLRMDLDLTQSSSTSSEEDQLLSLQQILEGSTRPPATPEKGAYPAPGTPTRPLSQSEPLPASSKVQSVNYRNTLDDMLKERMSNQRSKETKIKLQLSCEEDLLRLELEDQSDKNMQEAISNKQRELQREQRFSLSYSVVRDSHPGEEVFCLSYFGRLFNQHTLKLGQCDGTTQEIAQKTVLCPDQLRSQLGTGFLQAAYQSCPCPPQVSRWLFQMMSVHTEMSVSHQILQALRDIACSAAEHIEVNKNLEFEVWVPSVGDVTLVFMNMGAPYVTLFPLASLQPAFTEGDLLESLQVSTDSLSSKKELGTFPEHNFENVIRYLSDVTALCPRAYSDTELLLLLTVVSKVGLETQLALLPTDHLSSLEHSLVNNMRDWDNMLPLICLALTALTEDHHNLRRLLQLLPDNKRGLQLRRHLSVSMISKLLNQRCTYTPTNTEFQLSDLRPYLRHMRPSALLRSLQISRSRRRQHEEDDDNDDDPDSLDQQAHYLSYSLLALANEAARFEFFPPSQKDQLLLLCAELDKHIKCDIRESRKTLYQSKVKDFVAQIYTKWQMLLLRTRPLQGNLYDYWQPVPEEMTNSQES